MTRVARTLGQRAAIFRQVAAMSAAGVGPPIWSSTTRS
jgi:hypothetical protein